MASYHDYFEQGAAIRGPSLFDVMTQWRRNKLANQLMKEQGLATGGGGMDELVLRHRIQQLKAAQLRERLQNELLQRKAAATPRIDPLSPEGVRSRIGINKATPHGIGGVTPVEMTRYRSDLGEYKSRKDALQRQLDTVNKGLGQWGVPEEQFDALDQASDFGRLDDLTGQGDPNGKNFKATTPAGPIQGKWDDWVKSAPLRQRRKDLIKQLGGLQEPTAPAAPAGAPPAGDLEAKAQKAIAAGANPEQVRQRLLKLRAQSPAPAAPADADSAPAEAGDPDTDDDEN